MKNVGKLGDLNIEENWLMNIVMSQKLKYFGDVKHHICLEITVMNDVIIGRRDREVDTAHRRRPLHETGLAKRCLFWAGHEENNVPQEICYTERAMFHKEPAL